MLQKIDIDHVRETSQQPVANSIQIGGDHYRQFNSYQPWDVIQAWGLGFLDGNVVKYIARWRYKNGIQDLKKAQHYLTKLIENLENNEIK